MILVGVVLAPAVSNTVASARINATGVVGGAGVNLTGSSNTILGLTTLFYCLAVASTGIGIATLGLRNSGLM